MVTGPHKLCSYAELSVVSQYANRCDMSMWHFLALGYLLIGEVFILHFTKNITDNLASHFIDGDLRQLGVASHVVKPIA